MKNGTVAVIIVIVIVLAYLAGFGSSTLILRVGSSTSSSSTISNTPIGAYQARCPAPGEQLLLISDQYSNGQLFSDWYNCIDSPVTFTLSANEIGLRSNFNETGQGQTGDLEVSAYNIIDAIMNITTDQSTTCKVSVLNVTTCTYPSVPEGNMSFAAYQPSWPGLQMSPTYYLCTVSNETLCSYSHITVPYQSCVNFTCQGTPFCDLGTHVCTFNVRNVGTITGNVTSCNIGNDTATSPTSSNPTLVSPTFLGIVASGLTCSFNSFPEGASVGQHMLGTITSGNGQVVTWKGTYVIEDNPPVGSPAKIGGFYFNGSVSAGTLVAYFYLNDSNGANVVSDGLVDMKIWTSQNALVFSGSYAISASDFRVYSFQAAGGGMLWGYAIYFQPGDEVGGTGLGTATMTLTTNGGTSMSATCSAVDLD